MSKILFVGPDLNEVGGVSIYCAAILDSYPGKIEYFPFPVNMRNRPLSFISVILQFIGKLLINRKAAVQINTSLNTNAIVRDSFFILAALVLRIKLVVFIHGWDDYFAKSLLGIKMILFRSLFDRANAIIVLADQFKNDLQNFGFNTKIVVETTCYPPNLQRSLLMSTHDLWKDGSGPNILFLSRIVKEKGIFELYDACKQLRNDFPGLTLFVAGDGPDLPDFRDYVTAQDINCVTFCGTVSGEQKSKLFEKSHLFCLPTYYGEGLPVTILEALFFGLPVITTRVGGIAGVLKEGVSGFFVKARDITDLVEKIRILLSDHQKYHNISTNNAEYSHQFSSEIVAARLAILHKEFILPDSGNNK